MHEALHNRQHDQLHHTPMGWHAWGMLLCHISTLSEYTVAHAWKKMLKTAIFNTFSSMGDPVSYGWLHGTVVERWSLAGELSLSCARPVANG